MNNFLKHVSTALTVAIVALLSVRPAAADEVYQFRLMFEQIDGAASLEVGDLAAGIRQLEQKLQTDAENEGIVLATLCGGYVLARRLDEARSTCEDAVRRFPSESAYNNRGVLRAVDGDIDGARQDFDRARPADMAQYVEELKTRDIGFIATDNHELLQTFIAKQRTKQGNADVASSFSRLHGADVEIIE